MTPSVCRPIYRRNDYREALLIWVFVPFYSRYLAASLGHHERSADVQEMMSKITVSHRRDVTVASYQYDTHSENLL